MASTCFCFQVHQPDRLRHYTAFDTDNEYFDGFKNAEICHQVARTCYLPASQLLLSLIQKHHGRFKVAFSMTGVLLEQLRDHAPKVLESFQALADTGCVEFLAQTYYHSLSFLFSTVEFSEQVAAHRDLIRGLFGQTPHVFHNTERLYSNALVETIDRISDFDGILVHGVAPILADRSPNYIYAPPSGAGLKLLLRNDRLSDDIAFRFADPRWSEWPLKSQTYAGWIRATHGNAAVVNLGIDYETFGEHCRRETGIFDFIHDLPADILAHPCNDFKTPSEAVAFYEALDVLDAPTTPGEKTTEQSLSAWLGNLLQQDAAAELYQLESAVKATRDPNMLACWRKLQTRDHFSYMNMQRSKTGELCQYANPYDSPYDSYINFMNVLASVKARCAASNPASTNMQTNVA